MGRKAAAKRGYDWESGYTTKALKAHKARQHWHRAQEADHRSGDVVTLRMVSGVVMVDGQAQMQPMRKPFLHHMQQYTLFLSSKQEAMNQPSSHNLHRLLITGEQEVNGRTIPLWRFIARKTPLNRKGDRCFPRGKAFRRVVAIERGTAK